MSSLTEAGLSSEDEVIVVIDGHSFEVEKAYRELPIRVVQTDGKTGPSSARNLGASRARKEILGFLDDDDAYLPGALTFLRQHLPKCKSIGAWSLGWNSVGRGGKARHPWQYAMVREKVIRRRNRAGGCSSMVVRKSTFDRLMGFDENMIAQEDWDFWLRLSRATRVSILHRSMVLYDNRGADRISRSRRNRIDGLARILRKHGGNWPRRVVAYHQARLDGERYRAREGEFLAIPKFWAPLASMGFLIKYAGPRDS